MVNAIIVAGGPERVARQEGHSRHPYAATHINLFLTAKTRVHDGNQSRSVSGPIHVSKSFPVSRLAALKRSKGAGACVTANGSNPHQSRAAK